MNIIPTTYLFYDHAEQTWVDLSPEEAAGLNDPDASIIPVYENGQRGPQTTWGEWEPQLRQALKAPAREQTTGEKIKEALNKDLFAPAEKQEKRQPAITTATPPQLLPMKYLLTYTELPELISAAMKYIKLIYALTIFVVCLNVLLGLIMALK